MALFTRENAREMSAKANYVRWHKPDPEPKPEPKAETPAIAPAVIPEDGFAGKTLARVRKQIESLLDCLSKEDDPQRIDRLASALGRLNEIERQLAGRPMPGSLKPSSKPARIQVQAEPTPIAPQPVVSDSPTHPHVNDTEV